jgi:hypothetical protein
MFPDVTLHSNSKVLSLSQLMKQNQKDCSLNECHWRAAMLHVLPLPHISSLGTILRMHKVNCAELIANITAYA